MLLEFPMVSSVVATVPVRLLGWGSCVPQRVVTNDELSRTLNTSDEWIRSRTGIGERRLAEPEVVTSDLAVTAARRAVENAGKALSEVDLLVVATMSPDQPAPATAVIAQAKLGLGNVPAFDLNAACSGFLYGLEVVSSLVASGRYRCVLLIGAEKMSNLIDWQDRSTAVLFGDGAGAVILGTGTQGIEVVDTLLHADGRGTELLQIRGGGSARPLTPETLAQGEHFLRMNGKEVFKQAVREMADVTERLLARHGLTGGDLACLVPHQANTRIIQALTDRLGIPIERTFFNIDRYGNTSAASIPLALTEAAQAGRLPAGGYVLLVAFGAGLTWGASLLRT